MPTIFGGRAGLYKGLVHAAPAPASRPETVDGDGHDDLVVMTNHSIVVLPGAHASATPLEFAAGASLTQILAGNLNQRACYQQHAAVMRLLD